MTSKIIDGTGLSELSSRIKEKAVFWQNISEINPPAFSGIKSDLETVSLGYIIRADSNVGEKVGEGNVNATMIRLSSKLYLVAVKAAVSTSFSNNTGTTRHYHCRLNLANLGFTKWVDLACNLSAHADQFCHTAYVAWGGQGTEASPKLADTYGAVDNNFTNGQLYLRYLILGEKDD